MLYFFSLDDGELEDCCIEDVMASAKMSTFSEVTIGSLKTLAASILPSSFLVRDPDIFTDFDLSTSSWESKSFDVTCLIWNHEYSFLKLIQNGNLKLNSHSSTWS